MSLKGLEKLNGRPVILSGYDWDHPGRTVISWENGRLAIDLDGGHGQVWVYLSAPDPDTTSQEGIEIGNSGLSSDAPALRNFNSSVYEIRWEFPSYEQKSCPGGRGH